MRPARIAASWNLLFEWKTNTRPASAVAAFRAPILHRSRDLPGTTSISVFSHFAGLGCIMEVGRGSTAHCWRSRMSVRRLVPLFLLIGVLPALPAETEDVP